MRYSSESKREKYVVTTMEIGERTGAFLRRLYPDRTVDNVAADLSPWGIKADTIAAMLQRQTGPGSILWLALIWAYGPDFLSEVHPAPLGWLSAASREQKRQAIEAAMAKLRTELDGLE